MSTTFSYTRVRLLSLTEQFPWGWFCLRVLRTPFRSVDSHPPRGSTRYNESVIHLDHLSHKFTRRKGRSDRDSVLLLTSSTFLVVAIERFGERVMDHEADIRFVDSHSKRNSRNNNLYSETSICISSLLFFFFFFFCFTLSTYVNMVEAPFGVSTLACLHLMIGMIRRSLDTVLH